MRGHAVRKKLCPAENQSRWPRAYFIPVSAREQTQLLTFVGRLSASHGQLGGALTVQLPTLRLLDKTHFV